VFSTISHYFAELEKTIARYCAKRFSFYEPIVSNIGNYRTIRVVIVDWISNVQYRI